MAAFYCVRRNLHGFERARPGTRGTRGPSGSGSGSRAETRTKKGTRLQPLATMESRQPTAYQVVIERLPTKQVQQRFRTLGRFTVPFLALPASICSERYSQGIGVRPEVQPPVGLIAVQNAVRLKDAVLIHAFFYAQELTVLPNPIDTGRGRLAGPDDDLLRFLLLSGACRTEVNAAMESCDKKLIVAQLSHECASDRLCIPFGCTSPANAE